MEKVISVGKILEIKEGRTQQNKPFVAVKVLIELNNVKLKRNYVANTEYLINKIKHCKQGDIISIESTVGKVVFYKNDKNNETNYTINFYLSDVHKVNNQSFSYQKKNNDWELNLDFLDSNEKI